MIVFVPVSLPARVGHLRGGELGTYSQSVGAAVTAKKSRNLPPNQSIPISVSLSRATNDKFNETYQLVSETKDLLLTIYPVLFYFVVSYEKRSFKLALSLVFEAWEGVCSG
jgi:hypothetical protein